MVFGVYGPTGPLAQLLVGVGSIPEQGHVTVQRHLMEVANAQPMVLMILQQVPATPTHAPVSESLLT